MQEELHGINHELLDEARTLNELTIEKLALLSNVPEPTVKNILSGKTPNPSVKNVGAIARVVGVPIEQVLGYTPKTIVENQALKDGDPNVLALKEIYEFQIATLKETNEAHIANIRAHYEQHHEDLRENYERRLADKREIIDLLTAENIELKNSNKQQEKETRIGNLIRNLIIAAFVLCAIVLLGLEFVHPEHGWIRW